MKRRTFLKLTGSVCTSAFFGWPSSFAQGYGAVAAEDRAFIDSDMLRSRNQNRSTVVCQNGIVCTSQPLGSVAFERYIAEEVREQLADMGHKVRSGVGAFGGYQGIWRKDGPQRYFGGSDPRKDGCAIGY